MLDAMDASVVQGVLETHFGFIWGLRVLVWLGVGGVLLLIYRREELPVMRPATLSAAGLAMTRGFGSRPQLALLLVLLGFLGISPALAGHANAQDPTAVLLPVERGARDRDQRLDRRPRDAALRAPERDAPLPLPDRGRLLAAVLSRFSTIAGGASPSSC